MEQSGQKSTAQTKPRYVWDHKKLAWVETTEPISEEILAEPTRKEDLEEAPAQIAPIEAVAEVEGLQYKGAFVRLGAIIIDFLILLGPEYLIRKLAGTESIVASVLLPLLAFVYFVGFWTWRGQTLGKMIIGAKIVKTDGSAIGLGRAVLRYLVYMVYFFAITYSQSHDITVLTVVVIVFGYLIVVFSRKKRGLHDLIAGTCVVNTRYKAPQPDVATEAPDTADDSNASEPDASEQG